MCSNLYSVLDSIGLASNIFCCLSGFQIVSCLLSAHLPLSTYSIRDSIKKRGADTEAAHRRQSRKISLRLLLPIRVGTSWDCPWLPVTITFADKTWCLQAGSWYHLPGVNETFNKRVAQHPLISHKGMATLSLTNTSQKRAYSGAGLVQRQQLCLHKPLFSPRAAVHLIAAKAGGLVGHFQALDCCGLEIPTVYRKKQAPSQPVNPKCQHQTNLGFELHGNVRAPRLYSMDDSPPPPTLGEKGPSVVDTLQIST